MTGFRSLAAFASKVVEHDGNRDLPRVHCHLVSANIANNMEDAGNRQG